MIITYKNFTIEPDIGYYTLSEYKTKTNNSDNEGEIYLAYQWYPATLERCFERILQLIKKDKVAELELKDVIKEIKKINQDFLKELNILITNNKK